MKKTLVLILALVMLMSCLAGCGTKAAEEPKNEAPAEEAAVEETEAVEKETVKIYVPAWFYGFCKDMGDQYNTENPDSKYVMDVNELVADNSDINTKSIMMMQSSNTCPDVIAEDGFLVNNDAMAGHLSPLDDYIATFDDMDQIVPSIVNGARCELDNKVYGMPLNTSLNGLWYSKIMVEKAGYDPDTFQPKTWDEMLDAARKMQKVAQDEGREDFIPLYLNIASSDAERTSMKPMQTLYSGTDGVFYDFEIGKWVVDYENLGKVLNMYDIVYNKEHLGPPVSLATQTNNVNVIRSDHFVNDNIGMFIDSQSLNKAWAPNGEAPMEDWKDKIGFCLVPTENGDPDRPYTSIIGGWTMAIPANAAHKDGGWEFIQYIMSYDAYLKFCVEYNQMSVRKDVALDPSYIENPNAVYTFMDCTENTKWGFTRPTTEGYPTVSLLIAEMAEKIGTNQAPVEEIIKSFEDQLIADFGEDKVDIRK